MRQAFYSRQATNTLNLLPSLQTRNYVQFKEGLGDCFSLDSILKALQPTGHYILNMCYSRVDTWPSVYNTHIHIGVPGLSPGSTPGSSFLLMFSMGGSR